MGGVGAKKDDNKNVMYSTIFPPRSHPISGAGLSSRGNEDVIWVVVAVNESQHPFQFIWQNFTRSKVFFQSEEEKRTRVIASAVNVYRAHKVLRYVEYDARHWSGLLQFNPSTTGPDAAGVLQLSRAGQLSAPVGLLRWSVNLPGGVRPVQGQETSFY